MSVTDIVTSVISALTPGKPVFSLKVGGASLRVVRFSGHEAISNLFEFRVEVAGAELDPESLLNQPAALTIKGLDRPRRIHGMVSEAEYVGHTRHLQLYELTIVPWAHRLLHQYNSRVFQDKTTRQIITKVLTKAGLAKDWFRFSLVEKYAKRNYCVQYRETDFAFICRLLEEDGIFYFFRHRSDRHVWVMSDHVKVHRPIAGVPVVLFDPPLGLVQKQEHVHSFRFGGCVRPGTVSLRDYNLHKTGQKMEVKETAKANAELEVYDFPGEYQEPGRAAVHEGQLMAKIRLEALQATRKLGSGDSDVPRLTPGYVMTLAGHPRHELNAEYRLVQVNHAGSQPQVLDQDASGGNSYHNSFSVTELKVPFRPPRLTPRPVVRGVQTATVVGPEGEEVHTDEHGRVRVQFHWDRSDKFNETSATWVRVSQMWAGNRYGAMFLPRIGHEVLVDFIEGDPDRPIITGRIYTGQNETPYPLPAEKTKSTIKSDSSIGGGGFNEFRFEDLKGAEEIFLHAQKDWNTFAINNLTETVGSNRTSSVGSNETVSAGANRTVNVGMNDATTVGAEHKVTIAPPPPVIIKFPAIPFLPPIPPLVLQIPPTTLTMSTQLIELSTGFATVTIKGPDIMIEANGKIEVHAKGDLMLKSDAHTQLEGKTVTVKATGGDLLIQGPMVRINP